MKINEPEKCAKPNAPTVDRNFESLFIWCKVRRIPLCITDIINQGWSLEIGPYDFPCDISSLNVHVGGNGFNDFYAITAKLTEVGGIISVLAGITNLSRISSIILKLLSDAESFDDVIDEKAAEEFCERFGQGKFVDKELEKYGDYVLSTVKYML
jgi:hypothetical protein